MAAEGKELVLAINPGSTSTKFGVFAPGGPELVKAIRHGDEEQRLFSGRPLFERFDHRARQIRAALEEAGYVMRDFDAFAGRGGLLPPMPSGATLVDDAMVEWLRRAPRGEHASNLGAPIVLAFARKAGVNAYIVDPVTVDEWDEIAHLSGTPLLPRAPVCHVLNTKAICRRLARDRRQSYASLRLIVIHLGGGVTVSAHKDGRMIDATTAEEGAFGPDRAGGLAPRPLVRLCYSGQYSAQEMDRAVFGEGGLYAYLGTRELTEVLRRIDAGDEYAAKVFAAMVYQIAKEAGAMAVVLEGKVDAIALTGGMAYSERLVEEFRRLAGWIAPIALYPGEDELQALAEGVFRVLHGEEAAHRYVEPAMPIP